MSVVIDESHVQNHMHGSEGPQTLTAPGPLLVAIIDAFAASDT
jgi:hypothetical protein